MASSYTGLGTELMTTGENAGTWGTTTNTNLQIIEQISGGYTDFVYTLNTIYNLERIVRKCFNAVISFFVNDSDMTCFP